MLILILFTLSAVSAADNATTDVVGLEDANDNEISVEKIQTYGETENNATPEDKHNSFGDLEKLIDDAKSGSTIVLDRDYINDDYDDDGIKIKKDITIDGQGHTLDGNYKSRIFRVSDDYKIVFKDIIFARGQVHDGYSDPEDWRGGAINGYCTAINCYFTDNRATGWGSAMYSGIAINCTFEDNYGEDNIAVFRVDAKFCTFVNEDMKEGSRFLCLMKDGSESKDTEIIVPSFTMTGDTNTSLGGKLVFEMEYDGQKYDGYDVLISTTKKNGDEEDFHSSTGSEWTIPFVESRDYVISVNGYPEIKQYQGKFDVYSDVSPIKTNFTTEYDFEDNISIMIVDNLKRPMTNISVSYKIDGNVTETTTDKLEKTNDQYFCIL